MGIIEDRLPHKEPVRFIEKVELEAKNHSISLVKFKEKATLASVVEAAAQNIIFIKSLYEEFDGGVLTGMKNIELLDELGEGIYRVESTVLAKLDNFCTLSFVLSRENKPVVKGQINIVMEERI